MKITILLVDDQQLFRDMLEDILSRNDMFKIVATASNGFEAVEMVRQHQPDIVLMDIKMPEKSGINALRTIKEMSFNTKVIMLTTFEDAQSISEACIIGADGYLLKEIKPDILIMSIQCVYHNIVLFHKSAYEIIWSQSTLCNGTLKEKLMVNDIEFDGVELNIIRCIGDGMTNREIGAALKYSEGTIKNKLSRIYSKTGLNDRSQITVFAIKHNII